MREQKQIEIQGAYKALFKYFVVTDTTTAFRSKKMIGHIYFLNYSP